MEAIQVRVRTIRKQCAPKKFPCPACGKLGRRKDTHTRRVRDIAFGEIVFIELTVGEYRAACSCCKTFRSQIDGIEPRAEYTNRIRELVVDRLLDDGMSLNLSWHKVQVESCSPVLCEFSAARDAPWGTPPRNRA